LLLVGRNAAKLAVIASDLRVRGAARVEVLPFDFSEIDQLEALVSRAFAIFHGDKVEVSLIAFGTLTDQVRAERDLAYAAHEQRVNAVSTCMLLAALANRLLAQGSGRIGVISSVAGDRGRVSNYVYGSAKAMVSAFADGLRPRLARSGVALTLVKPGFIDTPMTASFKKGLLWAQPEVIAPVITAAIASGRPELYVPRFWGLVMRLLKAIPNRVFDRLPL
jgi:short-subunit dehydrogenase